MQKEQILQKKTQISYSTVGLNDQIDNMHPQSDIILQKQEQNQNNSMKKFCPEFYRSYKQRQNCLISINSLSQQFKVSKRRVYDIIGMFQGFHWIKKTKIRGNFIWLGMGNLIQKRNKQIILRSVTLKNVACAVKQDLSTNIKGLSFKQLKNFIIKRFHQSERQKVNEATLVRRIYECLKMMKDFQLITKEKNNFKWKKIETLSRQQQKQNKQRSLKITKQQKKLLQRIMKKVSNKQQLQRLLLKISEKEF